MAQPLHTVHKAPRTPNPTPVPTSLGCIQDLSLGLHSVHEPGTSSTRGVLLVSMSLPMSISACGWGNARLLHSQSQRKACYSRP